jgi:hypothetical protein
LHPSSFFNSFCFHLIIIIWFYKIDAW